MIQAVLVMKPAFDKSAFHNAVESVTGQNYLRETDNRNLREHTAEILSILRDYGNPHDTEHMVHVGFLFAGSIDLIIQLPTIVHGTFLHNQESDSQLIGNCIIVASLQEWKDACFRATSVGSVHLERCFNSVSDQVSSLTPPSLNRLRLN